MKPQLNRVRFFSLTHAFAFGLLTAACGGVSPHEPGSPMLHAEHGRLLNSRGQNILVQGVSCWFGEAPDAVDPDHDEADYERVAAMGFNSIRFHFNYNAFEDDSAPYQYKDSGFARFDQSIAWAKAHGIQLVLSLGVPQGGSQLNCGGTALWDIPDNQDRVVALWRAIAQRYATEPTLAGYSLIDQPSPTSSLAQWQSLANRIAAAIREVDVQHLLVVDQATPIGCNYDNQYNPGASLIVLDDPNVLYALAAYWPWVYTNQLTAGSHLEDAGAYPDEERLGTSDFQDLTLLQTHPGSPLLTPDETTWTRKRFYYTAVNQTAQIAQVSLRSANNPGTVYFDDLLVEEFDPDFNFVRTLIDADLEDPTNWNLYQDPAGAGAGVKGTGADGHRGSASITLSGTTGEASLNFSDLYAFPLRQNYTYRVTGWMKGENSAPNSASMIGLNLYTDIGSVPPPRNKANLAAMLQRFVDWGHSHDVPLYVGDLGTGAPSFENGRGGLTWVSDMVDLMTQANLSFSYSEYHGADYGIYRGDGGPVDPSNANQPLIDLFTQKLGQ